MKELSPDVELLSDVELPSDVEQLAMALQGFGESNILGVTPAAGPSSIRRPAPWHGFVVAMATGAGLAAANCRSVRCEQRSHH